MEYIEMIAWLALGFVPTLATLEYATRRVARKTLEKLYVSSGQGRRQDIGV